MRTLRSSRWLAILATVLLLMGTAAPALVRMHCLNGGQTVLSLGQADDCCHEEADAQGPTITAACCEMERTAPGRLDLQLESGPSLLAVVQHFTSVRVDLVRAPVEQVSAVAFSSRPPPLLTNERLSQVGSYLI